MFKQMVVNIIFNSVLLYFYNIEKLEVNAQQSKTNLSGSTRISVKMWKQGISVNRIFSIFPVLLNYDKICLCDSLSVSPNEHQ